MINWKKLTITILVLYFVVAITAFAATNWKPQPQPVILTRSVWNAPAPLWSLGSRGTGTLLVFHHSAGWPFTSTLLSDTATEIMRIRNMHVVENGWPDIGYHYIIDRAGRIWQGRLDSEQGIHTLSYNNNVGIVILGNYEGVWGLGAQHLTQASFDAMCAVSKWLAYRDSLDLPIAYAHSDFSNTACPGRNIRGFLFDLQGHLSIFMEKQ